MEPVETRLKNEREHFDRLASELGNVWWGHLTRAGQRRIERRSKAAAEFARLQPGVTVLEPGSGAGEFTEKLARSGATICAVELSASQVELARQKLGGTSNVRLIVGDAARLDFPDNHFDAVIGLSVLHHLELDPTLREFYRVLKPGARLFFSEPNMLNPQIFLEKNVKWIGRRLQNSPDETAFVRWTLAKKLRAAGYSEVKVVPVDFLHPGIPSFAVGFMEKVNAVLEVLPLVREIGGSLFIYASKPER